MSEPQSLMTETIRLLKQRHETLQEIQVATGIPFYWLRKFSGHEFRDPSVNRVQRLYEYLKGQKLAV
jgi:hypothetical protein